MQPPGDLIYVVGKTAHEARCTFQLWQIQTQNQSSQNNAPNERGLILDSGQLHLFLNDLILLRCGLETVVDGAFLVFVHALPPFLMGDG